jgi:hypothetical protein
MSLKTLLLAIMLLPILVFSQSVKVKKETSRIRGENADGYEVVLESPEQEVKNSMQKFLKTLGKIKEGDNNFTVNEPTIDGTKYTMPVYATTRQIGNTTAAWIGINVKDWGKKASSVDKPLEILVYDFGVGFYKEKIQSQIDESLYALQIVEKQQLRLTNQNKDLTNKLEGNKREKIQLEKSIANNKIEFENLTKNLEVNKKAQDSVAIATGQIKKVVEMHKERQRLVN